MRKIYLSGPMSGRLGFNIEAFDKAAARLRKLGYEVVSPAELDHPEFRQLCLASDGTKDDLEKRCRSAGIKPDTWGTLLARDIRLLADDGIEGVAVLPGWKGSRGALLETFAARMLRIPIYEYRSSDRPVLRSYKDDEVQNAHYYGGLLEGVRFGRHSFPPLNEFPPIERLQSEEKKERPDQTEGPKVHLAVTKAPEGPTFSNPQSEVRIVDADTGGEKGEKAEAFDLLPWPALAEVAKVYAFGAKKYQPNNWRKGFRWGLCFASKLRHLTAFWSGQSIDPETQCHHLASDVFHSLTLMEFERSKLGKDDRALHI